MRELDLVSSAKLNTTPPEDVKGFGSGGVDLSEVDGILVWSWVQIAG
jgi:hypothetical protein